MSIASYPLERLIIKRKAIRKQLLEAANQPGTRTQDIRIAVLGGSTTNEVVDLLEILLLDSGFRPTFFQSEYGRYYEDAVLEPEIIANFKPDLVYIHTGIQNIQAFQPVACTEADFPGFVAGELSRYKAIWTSLASAIGCQIIQNPDGYFGEPTWDKFWGPIDGAMKAHGVSTVPYCLTTKATLEQGGMITE